MSTISVGELHVWAFRSAASVKRQHILHQLLTEVRTLAVDDEVARVFGRTRAELLDRGVAVPVNDLFIAATALLHDLTVVTHNLRHFYLVPNLRVHDWLSDPG